MTKNDEIFKPVPDYEGIYEISNYGNLINVKRETVLKGHIDKDGYIITNISKNGKKRRVGFHQLVLWAFVGEQKKGIEVRHLNSIPNDNRLENLVYGTKSDNMKDAVKQGTLVFSRSKLTKEDVLRIAKDVRKNKEIAKEYNCCIATIHAIKTKRSFKEFSGEISYQCRETKTLSDDICKIIRDKNNKRSDIINKYGLTLGQVKRIRCGFNTIYC